jgi:Tfp pilus assembly protein PilN
MFQLRTLYIFLSKQTVWFWFNGKTRCLESVAKPLSPKRILELCHEWNASKVVLFLEFPWVLTHFETTITLSPEELKSYAKMQLVFHDIPESELQTSKQAKQTNSLSTELTVGGIYFKQAQTDRVGLLCATLSAESLSLKYLLKQEFTSTVELVPLISACVPILLKNSANSIIFKGLEQSFYLEKTDSLLTKLIELPSFSNVSQELFVADQLAQKTKPQSFRLIPLAKVGTFVENNSEVETEKTMPEPADIQNTVTIETVLSEWKGLAHSPKSGFWWAAQNNHRRLRRVGSWWTLAGVLILAIVAGTGLFYYETLKHRKVLQQELSSLEIELEQHINNSPTLIYAAREKHLEELEKLAKQMVEESFWKQQTLQTLLSSIEGAWLEGFNFEGRNLRLRLLALAPIDAVDLFLKLSKMPEADSVHFKSQQKTKINEHELTRFILLIKLAPTISTQQQ